jgi:hypothetical protein
MKWFKRSWGTHARARVDPSVATVRQPAPTPGDASDEDIKAIIREWIAALASQDYVRALAMIWPVVLRGSGSLNHERDQTWTPQLLEAVVNNYGVAARLFLRSVDGGMVLVLHDIHVL